MPGPNIPDDLAIPIYYDPFAKKRIKKVPSRKDEDMSPTTAKKGFTFGADPEVFIKNEKGVHVPPTGVIPGTKERPEYVGDDVFLQVDGMAAEFNITPCNTFEEFDVRVETAIKKIEDCLPKGWSIDVAPFVRFDPEVFEAARPEAKERGCHPDFNAWTGGINPPPGLEDDPYLWTAAGHLHFGWTTDADLTDPQHIMNCCDLVKQLDWYLGAWTVLQEPDSTRRKLYGKAGACRYKPYGVEYRVPSNFWIKTKTSRLMVWNRMQEAINQMSNLFFPDRAAGYTGLLIETIDTGRMNGYLKQMGQYPIQTLDGNRRQI
jgi:hypothetical protein